MLRSLTSQLEVHLNSSHVTVMETRIGLRPDESQLVSIPNSAHGGPPDWRASLLALDAWLTAAKHRGRRVEFVVSDYLVHYGLIPWTESVQSSDELNALGRAAFNVLYGEVSARWEVQVEYVDYGRPAIACAIDQALLLEIARLCETHALKLKKVHPQFMRIFNRIRKKVGPDGILAVVERGRCLLACIRDGAWHSVRSLSVGVGPARALDVLIEREVVLQGFDVNVPIYIHSVGASDLSVASKFPNAFLSEDVASPVVIAAEQPAEV